MLDADTAKRQMVEAVDAVTTRHGGDWRQRSGPDYAEDCPASGGRAMARRPSRPSWEAAGIGWGRSACPWHPTSSPSRASHCAFRGTPMGSEHRHRRCAVGAGVGALIVLMLAGCTTAGAEPASAPRTEAAAPSVDRDVAQQQMVAAVRTVTHRLSGSWKPRTGPGYLEDCRLPDGRQGAQWRYLVTRTAAGDVAQDVTATEDRCTEQGVTIERWGSAARPTVVGRGGGRTDSIRLTVAEGQYAVRSVSLCFPGDADDDS
jgi:hypothetical protein